MLAVPPVAPLCINMHLGFFEVSLLFVKCLLPLVLHPVLPEGASSIRLRIVDPLMLHPFLLEGALSIWLAVLDPLMLHPFLLERASNIRL